MLTSRNIYILLDDGSGNNCPAETVVSNIVLRTRLKGRKKFQGKSIASSGRKVVLHCVGGAQDENTVGNTLGHSLP